MTDDHGHGIRLGENVFINYNGTMLDGGLITIVLCALHRRKDRHS